jgi:hypothetical protein
MPERPVRAGGAGLRVDCANLFLLEHPTDTLHSRMRKIWPTLLLALFTLTGSSALSQSPFIFTCSEDANIQAAKRTLIESPANEFLQKLLGSHAEDAAGMMSKDGQANVTR